jgi:hypothetical protein
VRSSRPVMLPMVVVACCGRSSTTRLRAGERGAGRVGLEQLQRGLAGRPGHRAGRRCRSCRLGLRRVLHDDLLRRRSGRSRSEVLEAARLDGAASGRCSAGSRCR